MWNAKEVVLCFICVCLCFEATQQLLWLLQAGQGDERSLLLWKCCISISGLQILQKMNHELLFSLSLWRHSVTKRSLLFSSYIYSMGFSSYIYSTWGETLWGLILALFLFCWEKMVGLHNFSSHILRRWKCCTWRSCTSCVPPCPSPFAKSPLALLVNRPISVLDPTGVPVTGGPPITLK